VHELYVRGEWGYSQAIRGAGFGRSENRLGAPLL
jgi:hypothetical protein